MKTYVGQNGDRLDQIVFREYGTLTIFDKVVAANNHLGSRTVLKDGDIINLPVVEVEKITTKEVKSLW